MKAGWEVRPLGDVVEIKPPKREAKERLGTDGPVSFVPMEDLKVLQRTFAPKQVRPLSEVFGGYTYFAENDVLLAKITPCFENGKLSIASGLTNGIGFGSSEFMVLRCSPVLDPQYLFYFLSRNEFRETGRGRMTGAVGHKRVPPEFVEAQPIPLPPIEEQQRIVAVLDEAFEGLTRARAHAEANLQNARELFENSLISIFDEVEATAPRLTLAQAAITFGRGKSRHRPRNAPFLYGGDYPFVQTGDIRNSSGIVSTYTQTYSEHGLAQSKLWPAGTVCITIAANIAETAVLGFDACFPDSIIGMVANPEVTFPEYVEFMLRYFAAELKALGKGSAQDNINLATFEAATFPFPAIATQFEVVEKLTRLTEVTSQLAASYESKLQSIDALRQSLLQNAFAGELTGDAHV